MGSDLGFTLGAVEDMLKKNREFQQEITNSGCFLATCEWVFVMWRLLLASRLGVGAVRGEDVGCVLLDY